MTKLHHIILAAMLPLAIAAQPMDFPNAGFEQNLEHWTIGENDGNMSSISQEQAHSGSNALKVVDDHSGNGNWAMGPVIPCDGPAKLKISGWQFPVSGGGLGLYLQQLDANAQPIAAEVHLRSLGGNNQQWLPFQHTAWLDQNTRSVQIYFHSYSHAKVVAYVDDLAMERLPFSTEPLWPAQYKINPLETNRLTPADVVGPDGIVYPDWRRCGVQGGIPDVPTRIQLADFGAKPDDDLDDGPAIMAACAALPPEGGAILLAAGTYHLDRTLTIARDSVVIRGQGMGKTKIIFRYRIGDEGIQFYAPAANAQVGPKTRIELHALPTGLQSLSITVNDKQIGRWQASQHSGNSFATSVNGAAILKHVPEGGTITIAGSASYADGSSRHCAINVVLNPQEGDAPAPSSSAAILFQGTTNAGQRITLSADGKRGDTSIQVADSSTFAAGDHVIIEGPATTRWKTLTQNACRWGSYRKNALRIKAINNNTIHFDQPLRIEFPVIDGSYVVKQQPIQHCGVENLSIEQSENLWISSVVFNNAWNCWAKNVEVMMCGRFPIYGQQAKFCEIRDVVFRDAWFKGGGGTAYAGWEHSWDCLIDGIETFSYRHAPLFQWSASGCVIRNGVFHDSDAQWHSGWTNENLMEKCIVYSANKNGAYGYGMWASPPEDDAHGPNGPRNVVYNCDVFSPKTGFWLGGMNENWLVLHNRFTVDKGPGFMTRTHSFDHIINGNVFVLKDDRSPAITLVTPDCSGVDFTNNRVFGGAITSDATTKRILNDRNNVFFPLDQQHLATRPQPAVPSIFDWQRQQR